MKKVHLSLSLLMGAVLCLATMSWAGEASVFDDVEQIIIRAYTTGTEPNYSVYLEVRDSTGALLIPEDSLVGVSVLDVTGAPFTPTVDLPNKRYVIHNNTASSPDISMSLDSGYGITYLFCTDGNVMVMKYNIKNNNIVYGACGTTLNTCTTGTLDDIADSSTNYLWNCTGSNGGTNASCSLPKPVNGACGSSNGGTFTSAPNTNLCSAGTPTSVSGSGPWTWSCQGSNGGTNANCSANIQSSGSPDLGFAMSWGVITGIQGQSGGSNDNPFSETVTITNTGNAPAGSFNVKVWLSFATTIDSSSQLLYTWNVAGLAAGQSLTQTLSPLLFSGAGVHSYYYIVTKVDADNQITESNEAGCWPLATAGCNTFAYQFFIYR